MTERKSPPGPREMVQEHKVINTFSGIQFEGEGYVSPWICQECGHMVDTPQHELGCPLGSEGGGG